MGDSTGNIIAIIITAHIPRNVAAAPDQDCPGIRIHAIDMVQPPGMVMPGIDDMDAHHDRVSAALPRNSSAADTMNPRDPETLVAVHEFTYASTPAVLVVPLPPGTIRFVPPERSAV
jgi:hypothetical protein